MARNVIPMHFIPIFFLGIQQTLDFSFTSDANPHEDCSLWTFQPSISLWLRSFRVSSGTETSFTTPWVRAHQRREVFNFKINLFSSDSEVSCRLKIQFRSLWYFSLRTDMSFVVAQAGDGWEGSGSASPSENALFTISDATECLFWFSIRFTFVWLSAQSSRWKRKWS